MEQLPKVGVGVFIFRDGKFLMGQRRNAHGHGSWSVPGGHLEFGETWEQTARREVKEETGLEITNVRFGGVTNDYFKEENKHYVTIWMVSDYVDGEATITEPEKYVDIDWFSFNQLPEPLFLPWKELLASPFITAIRRAAQ